MAERGLGEGGGLCNRQGRAKKEGRAHFVLFAKVNQQEMEGTQKSKRRGLAQK